MALSGSFDYTITRDGIIQEAMERCGVLRLAKTAHADHITALSVSLNLKVKAAQGDGLQLFSYKDAFLFLEADRASYQLGPTGDHTTTAYDKTQLTNDEAAAQTTLTVDSIAGITNLDTIGIELDDGTLHWTTVNGVPAGSDVVITSGLPSLASAGNYVFAYVTNTIIERPLLIRDLFLRDVNNNDSPVEVIPWSEYRQFSRKTNTGPMIAAAYDPLLTNGRLFVYPTAQDVTDVLGFVYKKPVDDFDANTNNPAFPVDWFEWLVSEMCVVVANKFSLPLTERGWFKNLADEERAKVLDGEVGTSITFVPRFR
jgi:hypothetical protein